MEPKSSSPRRKPFILIDDREQEPYEFLPEEADTQIVRLPAGDYSLVGWHDRVAVERKSFDDFVATVVTRRDAFFDQLKVMQAMNASVIVVEATLERVVTGPWKTKTHRNTMIGIVQSIIHRWKVPIVFAGDRPYARLYTLEFLNRAMGWLR